MTRFATPALCLLLLQSASGAADTSAVNPAASEQAVLETYKRMEDADRKGDGLLWFGLRDRKTLEAMDPALKAAIRKGGRARPSVRYEAVTVRVLPNRAILFGKVVDPASGSTQYQNVFFVVEDGAWKVAREQWSDAPFDRFVLYALLPPDDGSFIRAGSPWKSIPYANTNKELRDSKELVWKMQATSDEAFLYVRFEANGSIPAPGSKVNSKLAGAGKTGAPSSAPPMRIAIGGPSTGQQELSFSVSDVVSTQGAFADKGKPAGNRFFVTYTLFVKNGAGEDIFEQSIGDDSGGRLLSVQERFVDARIPLAGLGITDPAAQTIELHEADSVLRILAYSVKRFGM